MGGYYDSQSDRLILASSNAMISVFKNNGNIDERFDEAFRQWRSTNMKGCINRQAGGRLYHSGNVMYYDEETDRVVYIGNKYVLEVNMDPMAKGSELGTLHDTKKWLDIE